jgi:hypothetical protein
LIDEKGFIHDLGTPNHGTQQTVVKNISKENLRLLFTLLWSSFPVLQILNFKIIRRATKSQQPGTHRSKRDPVNERRQHERPTRGRCARTTCTGATSEPEFVNAFKSRPVQYETGRFTSSTQNWSVQPVSTGSIIWTVFKTN